jgi:hypothetical protein
MAYLLPRAFIVFVGWGMTCALIFNVWSNAAAQVFYIAGAVWAFAGIVCFGYIRSLRREVQPDRSLRVGPRPN